MENQTLSQNQQLPPELDGYTLRVMELDDIVVLEYSKRQLYFRHIHPNSFPAELVEENLLFDVVAPNRQEAEKKMKGKVRKYNQKKSE
jgi:hypothetical protein